MEEKGLRLCRRVLKLSGVRVGVGGRKHDLVFGVLDAALRRQVTSRIETEIGVLHLDWSHGPQRLLAYAFGSVLEFYARSPLGVFIRETGPGVFIDVGANLGMYSLVARSLGWQVHAFEPEPRHAAFLERNAELVGSVHQVALSDAVGKLPLYFNPQNPGATSLVAADRYERGAEAVPVASFSLMVDDGRLGDLEGTEVLIKVDVEGLEVNVVRGMVAALDSGKFRATLWVEVRGDEAGRSPGSFREVAAMLGKRDYVALDPVSRRPVENLEHYGRMRETFDLLFAQGHE